MFKRIGELKLKEGVFSNGDHLTAWFDDTRRILKVSLCSKNYTLPDEAIIHLLVDSHGRLITDGDKWKKKCLELAARIDELEAAHEDYGDIDDLS